MIVKRYWLKKKFHNTSGRKGSYFIFDDRYKLTHRCYGYFLFGFIPLYIVSNKIN